MNRDDCDIKAVFNNRYASTGRSIDRRFENTHKTLTLDLESRGASIITESDEDFTEDELRLLASSKRNELRILRENEAIEIRDGNNINRRLFYIGVRTLNLESSIINAVNDSVKDRVEEGGVEKFCRPSFEDRYRKIQLLSEENQELRDSVCLDLYFDNPVMDELSNRDLIKYNKIINARANGDSLLSMLKVQVLKGEDYFERGTMDYILFCLADRARALAGFDSLDEMMKWVVLPNSKPRHIFTHNEQYKDLEEFYRFLSMNKELENWNVLGIPRFKVRKNALEQILIRYFELFNLDVEVIPKVAPEKGGKRLGELKDELVDYYKKFDKTLKGKINGSKTNRQKIALDRLREKMFKGERLGSIERQIIPRIGRCIHVAPVSGLVDEGSKNFIALWFKAWKSKQEDKALEGLRDEA